MNIIKEFSDMYLIKTGLQRHKLGCVTITFQAFDRKCAGGRFFLELHFALELCSSCNWVKVIIQIGLYNIVVGL